MDNKHDKLDDFLRDQLNDSSENAAWNVPGDHVFENAINAIPEKKKNNRRLWLIIPLLFLAVFIGREFMHMNQINKLENKITSLEESISTNSSSITKTNDQNNLATSSLNNSKLDIENETSSKNNFSVSNEAIAEDDNSVLSESDAGSSINTISKEDQAITVDNTSIATDASSTNSNPSPNKKSTVFVEESESSSQPSSSTAIDNAAINLELLAVDSENQQSLIADAQQQWSTPFIMPLPLSRLAIEEAYPDISLTTPSVEVTIPSKNILPMRYGVLVGGNQSWLTMKNIPESPVMRLYEYDNSQSGAGAYAFIEKPISNKLSLQAGIGYQLYQNRSVLEDKFFFDEENIIMMQDGQEIYQAPIDVINPLGDHSTMLEFRVSDEMKNNDVLSEYTTMKQKLHVVHFDISMGYKVLSINRFDVSIGAGLGIGYLAGLNNDFNVSCYHNGVLQSNRSETPKNLSDTQKWYGQAIGKVNIEYRLTERMGLVIETQYRGGISSLRRGTETNGSRTYLHAFGLSAGLTHNF